MTTENPPDSVPFPPNIYEEFRYITDGFETETSTVPDYLAYAIVKGLDVYFRTHNGEQAVLTKEAYRIAGSQQLNDSTSERLLEAALEFENGNIENGRTICETIANQLNRPHNTEKSAINSLGL